MPFMNEPPQKPAQPLQPEHDPTPPATPVDIRRQLGWWLLPNNLPSGSRRD